MKTIFVIAGVLVALALINEAYAIPLPLTPQQKAIFCDPRSSHMQVVNTTESETCGIPKSTNLNHTNSTLIQ